MVRGFARPRRLRNPRQRAVVEPVCRLLVPLSIAQWRPATPGKRLNDGWEATPEPCKVYVIRTLGRTTLPMGGDLSHEALERTKS